MFGSWEWNRSAMRPFLHDKASPKATHLCGLHGCAYFSLVLQQCSCLLCVNLYRCQTSHDCTRAWTSGYLHTRSRHFAPRKALMPNLRIGVLVTTIPAVAFPSISRPFIYLQNTSRASTHTQIYENSVTDGGRQQQSRLDDDFLPCFLGTD